MGNELKDIAERLTNYSNTEGWVIVSAERKEDGSWTLNIEPLKKEEKNDNSANS